MLFNLEIKLNYKLKIQIALTLLFLTALCSCRVGHDFIIYSYKAETSKDLVQFWYCLRKTDKKCVDYAADYYSTFVDLTGRSTTFDAGDGYYYKNYKFEEITAVHSKNVELTKRLVREGYNVDKLFKHVSKFGSVESFKYLVNHKKLQEKPDQVDFQRLFDEAITFSNYKLAKYIFKNYTIYLYNSNNPDKINPDIMSPAFKIALLSDYSYELLSFFIKKAGSLPFIDESGQNVFDILTQNKNTALSYEQTLQLLLQKFKNEKKNSSIIQSSTISVRNGDYIFLKQMRKYFKIQFSLKSKDMGIAIGNIILRLINNKKHSLITHIKPLFRESKYKPNLNVRLMGTYGCSPLILAAKANDYNLVEFLITHKANVNFRDYNKESPLFYAVRNDNYKIAELLISHKANLNFRNKNKKNILTFVKSEKILKLLIKNKANINALIRNNKYIHPKIVLFLIQNGVSIQKFKNLNFDLRDIKNNAIFKIRFLMISKGLKKDLIPLDETGILSFFLSASDENMKLFFEYKDKGYLTFNASDAHFYLKNLIRLGSYSNYKKLFEYLKSKGLINKNQIKKDLYLINPAFYRKYRRDKEFKRYFSNYEKGKSIQEYFTDSFFNNPDLSKAQFYLELQLNVNFKIKKYPNPLFALIHKTVNEDKYNKSSKINEALLKNVGVNENSQPHSNKFYYQYVEDRMLFLIKNKININQQDKNGNTVLHIIAKNEHGYFIRDILDRTSIDINLQNKDKKTALHYAVKNSSYWMVRILIKKGANPNLRDKKGKSALDYAIESKDEKLIKLLKVYNSNPLPLRFKKRVIYH